MISLVRLEIQKLFRRKFVLVLLLIYGVVLLFMIYAGNPNRFSSILTSEGDVLKGREAVQYEKELAESYGTLSDQDVQEILEENARILGEFTDENQMKDDVHYRYANGFYAAVAKVFTDADGNYNHLPADQVYPGQEGLMQGGFTSGMDMMLSYVTTFLLFAAVLLIVMIAPVFSDEYTSGMDSLILSSRYGKTRCARAKILASFLTAVTILIGTVVFIVLVTIGYFGTDGFAVDAHLCATGMIGMAPFALPYWKALLILISLGLGAIMMLTGFALAASALGTSSFTSVLVTLVFSADLFVGSVGYSVAQSSPGTMSGESRFTCQSICASGISDRRSHCSGLSDGNRGCSLFHPGLCCLFLFWIQKPSGALIKGCA